MSPTLGLLAGETLGRISGERETQIGTWNFPLSRIKSPCLFLEELGTQLERAAPNH
ncbi:hypothetical protein N657DRAFT_648511 [Parathielavia appendiculata]|uniref:Uncharacterized protein n=1 Tax=Parathielavia appendiculata TaxID=2587402 RepID=A0AAN6Z220_9PEZI|nr:hypothetical protein N657DRAFT_648511 [Parathielavia appendiculata]